MTILPPPRAYIDWKMPSDADGNEIIDLSCTIKQGKDMQLRDEYEKAIGVQLEGANYILYLKWLSLYLYETKIPVPLSQTGLIERANDPESAIMSLADCYSDALFVCYCDDYDSDFEENTPYSEIHERELENLKKRKEEDAEEGIVTDSEDFMSEYCISEEDYETLRQEYIERKKIPSHIRSLDIPYRPVLAALLKRVPDPIERFRLLFLFFEGVSYYAYK
jgi:hypothetical protein